jgi:uncharacterized lipoprotein
MKLIVKKYPTAVLLFGAGLVSCASGDDKYRSIEMLERPPTLIVDKKNASQPVEENLQTETESGLGDKVTFSESDPLRLTIKQPFVQAWNTVELALTQQELAITDRNRDKGQFYIVYKPGGFFSKLLDFSSALHNDANYILTLEDKDDETAVSVTLIEPDNSQASPDGYYDAPEDKSKALLQTLYDTLRNDLKTD